MKMDRDAIAAYLEKWQKILRLRDWDTYGLF